MSDSQLYENQKTIEGLLPEFLDLRTWITGGFTSGVADSDPQLGLDGAHIWVHDPQATVAQRALVGDRMFAYKRIPGKRVQVGVRIRGGELVCIAPMTDEVSADANLAYAQAASQTTINVVIENGGSVLASGIVCDLMVDFNCTLVAATLLADQDGNLVIDIWKTDYASFPPTVTDTITASAKPTLSSASSSQDTTLSGWSTAITSGDVLRFNIDSAATVLRATLALKVQLP
jgi:hypothetical protein